MIDKAKIGNFEAACLLLNMIASKILLDFPRNAAEDAGTAGWLMTLLVSVIVFCLFVILSGLYKKFAGQNILELGETAFGVGGRIIIGLLFMLQFLMFIPIRLREFAEDMKVISLTSTPVSVVILLFCAGMAVGTYLGIETLARIHVLTVPILAGAFIIILLMNIPNFDVSRLAPWFGLGSDAILQKSVTSLSAFSELVVLFFIMAFLHKKNDFSSIGRYSLFFSGLFFVLTTLCYTLAFQYPTSTEYFLPMYQMARSIRLGRFFTRIESAFIVIWGCSAFLYLSSGLYFITWLFKRAFNLQYQRPLILPFIILIFTLSMAPENLYTTLQVEMRLYRNYSWLITFVLPLIILMSAVSRTRRKRKKEAVIE